MNIREAQKKLLLALSALYDDREASNISTLVLEKITGWRKIDQVINRDVSLSPSQLNTLEHFAQQLKSGMPVQYVLQEAWFYHLPFFVDEHVLIPRPETEELVAWIIADLQGSKNDRLNILDIGTGSGCIPVTLKKNVPALNIAACDISEGALVVAEKNASRQQIGIELIRLDFLDRTARETLPVYDLLISNPPYIPQTEENTLAAHVLNFEPHHALFPPGDDPLIFYREIISFSQTHLSNQGSIYLELHEDLAEAVHALFPSGKFSSVTLKKDLQGKNRFLKATMLL